MKSTYTPRQIQSATFFGGPLAAAYILKKSFESVNKKDLATKSFYICLLGSALLIALLPYLPEKTPSNVITLVYFLPVVFLIKKQYLTKEEIVASEEYQCESTWKVWGISLAGIVMFFASAIGVLWLAQTDDDIAQGIVDNVNSSNVELNADYFVKLEAEKDEVGPGVILNWTLDNQVVHAIKETSKDEIEELAVNLFGREELHELAKNNIYIIFNFQNSVKEAVKTVTLSTDDLQSI